MVCAYLRVVHVPKEEVGVGIQDEVSAIEFVSILILFYVKETTDAILPVQIRHLPPKLPIQPLFS